MPVKKHLIPLEDAKIMVAAHRNLNPESTQSLTSPREVFEALLSVPGCVSIRSYYALHAKGHSTMVFVAVDVNGDDILTPGLTIQNGSSTMTLDPDEVVIIDESRPCPPFCNGTKI